jgi:hypothetical protein
MDGTIALTPNGEDIIKFPCAIPIGAFFVTALAKLVEKKPQDPSQYLYAACVVASWMDLQTSIFYRPPKRQGCSATHQDELDRLSSVHQGLYKNDCLETFLCIWQDYFQEDNHHEWAVENGIFEKGLHEINRHKSDFLRTMRDRLGVRLPRETMDAFEENHVRSMPITTPEVLQFLREVIGISHRRWTFKPASFSMKGTVYNKMHGEQSAIGYIVDKFSRSNVPSNTTQKIVALTQKRKSSGIVFLSGTILLSE